MFCFPQRMLSTKNEIDYRSLEQIEKLQSLVQEKGKPEKQKLGPAMKTRFFPSRVPEVPLLASD